MSKKQIYKPKPISGFPEWLPAERLVEQQWFDHIRHVFESYGFCNIETPSVEALDAINAKGSDGDDVDKEVYVIERLHKEDGDKEARLALHFDQTVPLARYTAQHFNELTFPFKRYQMQRVWRGERPQAGRFREFYQCDIDVINPDTLPLHFDAEMPAIIWETLSSLPGMEKENIQIRISNRKILQGTLKQLEIGNLEDEKAQLLRIIDKKEKVGVDQTKADLLSLFPAQPGMVSTFLAITNIKVTTSEELKTKMEEVFPFIKEAKADVLLEGVTELSHVLDQLSHLPEGAVVADLGIVRGLDYYTGTVYETVFTEDPGYGSICSGGRYDDLASNYINKKLPGVGISIGFSRLFDRLRQKGAFDTSRSSPADIYMVLPNEEQRAITNETAQTLRNRGLKVETAHGGKLKKQLATAEKKGIPYVWFPPFEDGAAHEVKNMESGEQTNADPENWKPDA